jgi:hypothetical protein
MTRDLGETLAALKHNLQTASRFGEPWDQFHDEVAVPSIMASIGAPADNPRLERCLEMIAGRMFNDREAAVADVCFNHVAEHGFWHGSAVVAGHVAILFYFDDEQIGLIGFMKSVYSTEVRLARVRALAVPEGSWSGVAGSERGN